VHHILKLLHAVTTELHSCVQPLFKNETSKEIWDFYPGLIALFVFSSLIDADRLNTADFVGPGGSAAGFRPANPKRTYFPWGVRDACVLRVF